MKPQPQLARDIHFPAPILGVDNVSTVSALGDGFCHYAYNLIPGDKGLNVRPGYAEWAIELHGAEDHTVRTTLAFTGSAKNGTSDKLFAVTAVGIWDVTDSTGSPTDVINFDTISGDAGYGTAVVATTLAGRFLLYCDEENGLFVYSEASETWSKVAGDATVPWSGSTLYVTGDVVVNGDKVYLCDQDGTSAASGGPTGTGADIADGTARWDYVGAALSSVIGPSLADQHAGFACDPSDFAQVAVWGSRVWFVEKDSTRAWYLDVGAIYGTATSFNFGAKFQKGGPLRGLWTWSYDGGSGLDNLLVGVSAAGDVVIYRGTDPSSASTFGLKGSWNVGSVPAGGRFVADVGGELFVISAIGIVPLSRLVSGSEAADISATLTRRIGGFFARLVNVYGSNRGWAMHVHPTANCLLVLVPTSNDGDTVQLAYSFATKGWFQWRGLPVLSAATWNKELYFGTPDGRMCRQTGVLDNVDFEFPDTSYDFIPFAGMTAYRNEGNARNKQVQLIRPVLDSENVNSFCNTTARYDYDTTEPATRNADTFGENTGWDAALWDSSLWDGGTITQRLGGASGMGRAVAVAFEGQANGALTVIGFDVQWTEGGTL